MSRYAAIQAQFRQSPATWLVTGSAGFIGSNLLEKLLLLDQRVVGLDNFSTGHRRNLDAVRALVTPAQWARFRFIEGDVCALEVCQAACAGVDHVLHHAALGSVPRSLDHPLRSHASNVDGFMHMLVAAREAGVKRFVFASSSSVYGDHPGLPKVEDAIGRPLSPYAATKRIDEIYADVFRRCYQLPVVGLRYFNVFGPRQDPNGAYAAVIPKWFAAMRAGEAVTINGDGRTSRDFCYIENVVQANLLAVAAAAPQELPPVFNVACGESTTLLELHAHMSGLLDTLGPQGKVRAPAFQPERAGDVRHSLASIELARTRLGFEPTHRLAEGLRLTLAALPGSGASAAAVTHG
ncbi:SDR family oxidoreductase [Horticoccus sp. 23ND18S-11]|uniref:SDR family oxidoreductase n=1 Tax=Horticoccus sp. 23ND18S-11 TaxID=3391832 RepID=UPI0039C8C539